MQPQAYKHIYVCIYIARERERGFFVYLYGTYTYTPHIYVYIDRYKCTQFAIYRYTLATPYHHLKLARSQGSPVR